MDEFLSFHNLAALAALTGLEIVLGIDNVVFLAIVVQRVEEQSRARARVIGLLLAMVIRILLLFGISSIMSLHRPLFEIGASTFSAKSLILLTGGLFLMWKSTLEIHGMMDRDSRGPDGPQRHSSFASVIFQIVIIDAVFSLDSVITAVGIADHIGVMVTAIIISVAIMLLFAKGISSFIEAHPTLKMLALSFLMLVGVMLLADGFGVHVNRGYIYFAICFSFMVEMLNMRVRRKRN